MNPNILQWSLLTKKYESYFLWGKNLLLKIISQFILHMMRHVSKRF